MSGSDLTPKDVNWLQVMMDQFIKLLISTADLQVMQNLFFFCFVLLREL